LKIACASVPILFGLLLLVGLLLMVPQSTSAKPEYSRMTDQECGYCHVPNSRKLTDAGTYYRQHRTLKGFVPPKSK
jgi:hypothetical protein